MPAEADHTVSELLERGYEAFRTGEVRRSEELNRRALALARERANVPEQVQALAGLMRLALGARDFDAVEQHAAHAVELSEATSDRSLLRLPLHMRAEAARMQGDLVLARQLYDASIALNRELGNDQMVAAELGNKAWAEIADGRLDEAEELAHESLDLVAHDDAYGRAFCVLALARIALERGQPEGASRLREAEALLEPAGLVWDPAEEPEYVRTRELADAIRRTEHGSG